MAAHDEVESALTLAGAAFTDDQNAQTEHVEQTGVNDRPFSEAVFEDRTQLGDRHRGGDRCLQQRTTGSLRFGEQRRGRREATGDKHTWKVVRHGETETARTGLFTQALE